MIDKIKVRQGEPVKQVLSCCIYSLCKLKQVILTKMSFQEP